MGGDGEGVVEGFAQSLVGCRVVVGAGSFQLFGVGAFDGAFVVGGFYAQYLPTVHIALLLRERPSESRILFSDGRLGRVG
jgi:hypothetical protein